MNAAPSPADRCDLRIGTCGYSYAEWVESGFYPPGTSQSQMLPRYAGRFSAVELNHTWYQMPRPEAIERQARRAPDGFLFAAKLTRTLTHEVDFRAFAEETAAYRRGIAPLAQAGRLLAVLIQFPPGFDRTTAHRRHLANLIGALEGLPLAVEFRNPGWAVERVVDEFARRRLALVAVDEPALPWLFPTLETVTSPDLFYARLHGRNGPGWQAGGMQRQFDYDYRPDELDEWADRIGRMAGQARRGAVFFNNHVRGQAPKNAFELWETLRRRGLADGR